MKPKLLILKTDPSLPDIEGDWLDECEIKTTMELSHHKILPLLMTEKPQVLIVNTDGSSLKTLSLCSKIRRYFEGSILVIAPHNNTEYKKALLDCGADDFLTAPVTGQIMTDRIKHFSMKTNVSKVAIPPDNQKPNLQIGNILLDKTKRVVSIDNREINLTASEFDLLWLLASNKNRIVSRESLYQVLLKTEYDGLDRCIDNRISRLKRKLQDNSINPQLIKSVRSEGYILVEE
ncbi:MAG: winged helix-turn-helix domain-containing protein [candidate division Zixibacteria bacterium]|nr:winged helix-turn-helix domain-containing protein [candidate division Zixibacteria bacterium]